MEMQPSEKEYVLDRLETILQEVTLLRQILLRESPPTQPVESLTDQLLGCLGEEHLSNYDYSLDWQRFSHS